MKTELFRKVQCSERLPKYGKKVIVGRWDEIIDQKHRRDKSFDHNDGWYFTPKPTWWLEPIEPVSVHQIKDYLHSEFVGHALTEHIRNEYQEKLAQAIHDLIYGKEGEG